MPVKTEVKTYEKKTKSGKNIFVMLKDKYGHEIEILIPIENKEILVELIRGE